MICSCHLGSGKTASGATEHTPIRKHHAHRTIDIHCHIFNLEAEALAARDPGMAQFREAVRLMLPESSRQLMEAQLAELQPKLTQLDVRLCDMDAMGVDTQVLSPSPHQYHYWAGEALAEQLVRIQNEHIAAIVARKPERFSGFGALALQHPQLAVRQLEEALQDFGLKGVELSTTAGGMEYSDPKLAPLWKRAEELGAIIFVHPLGSTFGTRLMPYYLSNVIGQPIETTTALSHLIFSGVLDRHPRLKICAAHGGGYLPSYIGRSDHGHRVRPECRSIARPPSEYLRGMYFDTLVHSPTVLRALIEQVGLSQIVVGTDYPFDMGDYAIETLIESTPQLTATERAAILGGNAERLLGL